MQVFDEMQVQAKALADPSRFQIFKFIASSDEPVAVAQLTELLGFNHNAIRQHLAVLVEARLLTESSEERKVRGRPRKQYRVRADALSAFRSVSGSYERLAELLLKIATSDASAFDVGFATGKADAATGSRSSTDGVRSLLGNLATEGFEPERSASDTIELHHCPFADLAAERPGIVCEIHRGIIQGQLSVLDEALTGSLSPRDPHRAGCLIHVESAQVESAHVDDDPDAP